jgi:hypothetical protein
LGIVVLGCGLGLAGWVLGLVLGAAVALSSFLPPDAHASVIARQKIQRTSAR